MANINLLKKYNKVFETFDGKVYWYENDDVLEDPVMSEKRLDKQLERNGYIPVGDLNNNKTKKEVWVKTKGVKGIKFEREKAQYASGRDALVLYVTYEDDSDDAVVRLNYPKSENDDVCLLLREFVLKLIDEEAADEFFLRLFL